jgi:hypothetical protein
VLPRRASRELACLKILRIKARELFGYLVPRDTRSSPAISNQ